MVSGTEGDSLMQRAHRVATTAVACTTLWCAVVAAVPEAARAQSAVRYVNRDADTSSAGTSDTAWQFGQCMAGITYGVPLRLAASYGMGFVREYPSHDLCTLGVTRLGLGGAEVSAGLAISSGPFGTGAAVTAGLLRTFNEPRGALARRNYLGASLHVWPLLALGGEIGVFRRLGTDPAQVTTGRNLVVWSLGFGF